MYQEWQGADGNMPELPADSGPSHRSQKETVMRFTQLSLALLLLLSTSVPGRAQSWFVDGDPEDRLGWCVSGVVDFDGDGFDDFSVGSVTFDVAGGVQLISGRDQSLLLGGNGGYATSDALLHLDGTTRCTLSGQPDVANEGWVWRNCPLSRVSHPGDPSSAYGTSLSKIGEINSIIGDEYIVGAPGSLGSLGGYVVVRDTSDSDIPIVRHDGLQLNEDFGRAVAGLDDLDGDGFLDYAVGSPLYNHGSPFSIIDTGKVTIYSGRTHTVMDTLVGGGSFAYFGTSIDKIGDIDQDGVDEIIIGETGDSTAADEGGAAYVYSGQTRTLLHAIEGDFIAEHLGTSVAGAGDVNGDGIQDFIVGAPNNSQNAVNAGRALIYSGTGALLEEVLGTQTGWLLGFSVSGDVDLNADGLSDALIGMPGANVNGTNSGRLQVKLSCAADVSSYGTGWTGTNGVPALSLDGDPVYGASRMLTIGNSLGRFTIAFLYVGVTPGSFPTSRGGTLLLTPIQTRVLTIPGSGLNMPITIPSAWPQPACFPPIYLQAMEADAGASHGYSFTPGLRLQLGQFATP